MEKKYIAMIAAIVVVFLFILGFFVGDQSVDVAGCSAKWKTVDITTTDPELCTKGSCTASPADQQHNAIVSAISCACETARGTGYSSETDNKRIAEVTSLYFGFDLTTQQICGAEGQQFLIRRAYG